MFLPRHGRGHRIPPTEINYRANIDALKRLGVTDLRLGLRRAVRYKEAFARARSCSSTSSWTARCARESSSSAPAASRTSRRPIRSAPRSSDLAARRQAEGIPARARRRRPRAWRGRSSRRAPSRSYQAWARHHPHDLMPEAKLAREAEICYAAVAMVTDYDCWHEAHGAVDVATARGDGRDAARRSGCSLVGRAISRPHDAVSGRLRPRARQRDITPPAARDPRCSRARPSRAACSAPEVLGRHEGPRPAYRTIFVPTTAGRRGHRPDAPAVRVRAAAPAPRPTGRRGDPRHGRARRAADRCHGRLRGGLGCAPTPSDALERDVRAARRDAADRGQPALGAGAHAARAAAAAGANASRRAYAEAAPHRRRGRRACAAIGRHGLR